MKYMLPHLKSYRLQFIIGPLFKLLEAVLELTMPLYMAKIVDIGIPSGDRGYILKMGGLMLLTATVGLWDLSARRPVPKGAGSLLVTGGVVRCGHADQPDYQ